MDVTPEANVRSMELHLLPPNIQNECFSERSHFMFCSHDIPCRDILYLYRKERYLIGRLFRPLLPPEHVVYVPDVMKLHV